MSEYVFYIIGALAVFGGLLKVVYEEGKSVAGKEFRHREYVLNDIKFELKLAESNERCANQYAEHLKSELDKAQDKIEGLRHHLHNACLQLADKSKPKLP